jgi:hypothetical protein
VKPTGELTVDIYHRPGAPVRVDFRGKSAHRQPEMILRPLFADIAKTATTYGAPVEMHFEELDFFNTSTITTVIHFIQELRNKQVPMILSYKADHKWQKVFFDALGMLAMSDGRLKICAV